MKNKFLNLQGLERFLQKIKGSIPTKTSELQNDSGYITTQGTYDSALSDTSEKAVQNKVIKKALDDKADTGHTHVSSEITDLSIPSKTSDLTNDSGFITGVSWNDVSSKPSSFTPASHTHVSSEVSGLSTVATSGSYNDLSNKPSIPSKTSDLTNDSGFLTSHNPVDSALSSTSTNAVQNKVVKAELDNKANSADLSTVAATGSYTDLNNIPSNFTPASHTHGSITNDGKLGTASRALITDGNKNVTVSSVTSTELGYLSGVTSAVQDQLNGKAALTHSHTASEVSGLATVATSGSYNDLSNKPIIPTVYNKTLTIQKNGTTVKTFTANSNADVTANITVPTKTSDLTNDSGFLTSHNPVDSALSDTSANAVQNKAVKVALDGKSDTGHTHTASEVSGLSTVATSGSYNDLSNKPTIPTVNNATLTIQKNGTTVKTFTANASSNVTANIAVPTKVSELTNDSGFLTSASSLDSSKLTGTIDIARLPKGALERLVTVADQTARFALTTSDVQLGDTVKQLDTGVMYIVTDESKLSSADGYTEYTAGAATSVPWSGVTGKPSSYTPASHSHGNIANGGTLGTASMALITDGNKKITTSSVTSTELGYLSGVTSAIQTQLNGKAASSHTHTASEVSGLATVATSGSYNDLSNKPTIDSALSSTSTNAVQNKVINSALAGKAASSHTHTKSQITDFPTKTSQFTNDSHQTITVGTDTTSTASPAHSGTFTCIDSVTRDSNGHVTAVNTKTVTLPGDNNTDTLVTQNVSTANENHPVLLTVTKDATANQGAKTSIFASGVKVNPSTNTVTATTFSGALSGNASTATQFSANKSVTLTGDVTGTASSKAGWSVATTLSDSGVTAGTYGPSADVTGNNNATISVPEITVDSKGRVTSVANRTLTCKNNTYNVYNKTLTIQKNGTNVATFTSNSNTDVTANIVVPTKTSELTNDSGFLTSHQSLSNYVTLNSEQTITGNKNFEGQLKINGYNWIIRYKTQGTSNYANYDTFKQIEYNRYNNIITLRRSVGVLNSGDNFNVVDTSFAFYKIHVNNKYVDLVDNTRFLNDGTNNYVVPLTDNVTFFGSSTNRWKEAFAYTFRGTLANNGDAFSYTTANALYYYSGQPAIANCSEGSSNNFTKFSYPTGATTVSSSNANIQSLRLVWGDTYWHEIFSSPNQRYLWHRDVRGGVAKPWTRLIEEDNTVTWDINIGGSSASCTGNAATATQFSANKSVTLTGDVTGTASSKAGWSVAATLANSGVTAGTYGPSADVTGNNNATISVPQITVDAKGRVTSVTNRTLTCKNNTYTVNNATLTIQKNGTNVATFTSNASSNATANITVPTKTSELTNDSGYLTSHQSLSNYVTLNGAQTITGSKDFSSNSYVTVCGYRFRVKNDSMVLGTTPSSNQWTGFSFTGKDDTLISEIVQSFQKNGNSLYQINVFPNEANSEKRSVIAWTYNSATGANFTSFTSAVIPQSTNAYDLGTSTNQWKSVHATTFTGSLTGNVTGNCSGSSGSCTGNAATATTFKTARKINGVSFNGSADITIADSTKLPLAGGTITGDLKFSTTSTRGTAPSGTITKRVADYVDSAGNNIGFITMYYFSDMSSETRIYAYKTTAATGGNIGSIGIGCDSSGNVYTRAPTPATSDDSTKMATTAFVKDAIPYVLSGGAHTSAGGISPVNGTIILGGTAYSSATAPVGTGIVVAGNKLSYAKVYWDGQNSKFVFTYGDNVGSGTWKLLGASATPSSAWSTCAIFGLWIKIA